LAWAKSGDAAQLTATSKAIAFALSDGGNRPRSQGGDPDLDLDLDLESSGSKRIGRSIDGTARQAQIISAGA
jgi:hypothetical protein